MKKVLFLTLFFVTALMAAQEKVNIIIKTNAPGAALYLDNQQAGVIGTKGSKLLQAISTGNHTIKIEKKGYLTLIATIKVGQLENYFKFNLARENITTQQTGNHATEVKQTGDGIKPEFIFAVLFFLILAVILFFLVRLIESFRSLGVMGKFELLKVIGKGGIATIYKAKDLNRNKTIALKVMDCILLKDADLVYKFFCEGEAITTINEKFPDAPVVKVFEYGRDREKSLGVPYIAMELIKGSNLLDIMKNDHFLTVKRKLYIIKQVAMALIAAHRLKIYHGDITPDNIIVNEDKVTLIDFGISVREHDTYKNMDASITGKPVYMSPEQCTGHPVDDKSDIYSLGIILYFMCSGTPPFIHRNSTEIMKMHPEKPVPEIKEPIPEELKDFIKKMLAKKKGTRPDAREVVNKMESFMNQMQEQELPIQELKKEGSKFQRFYEKMNNKISWVNKRQNILINLKKISRDAWRRIMK